MQPRFTGGILVLQAEGWVRRSRYVRLTLQFAPAVIIPKQNQVAVFIAVEVVGLLAAFAVFVGPVMYLRQGFVAVGDGLKE